MISHASTGSSPEDDARATYVADGDSDARGSPALATVDCNDVPRRSFSSSFAHDAAHRPSKTSGRLRRSNRSVGHDDNNSRRRVSAPAGGLPPSVDHASGLTSLVAAPGYRPLTLNSAATEPRLAPTRISSSPLPPLSSHPTMTPDLFTQSVAVGGGTAQRLRRAQLSASPTSSVSAVLSPRRAPLHEASSTLGSLDGDEDDTDFKSDTIFDSLRTIDSGRARAVETPLESLYDESPTGTGNKKRSKRVSIQEILARSLEDDVDFMEESEFTTQPPVMPPTRQESQHDSSSGMNPSSPRQQSPITRDPHHLSLSDAFHEDWTGDEEDVPFSALSPPSKGNFLNPSRAHPNVRLALPRPTPSPQATQAPPSESLQTIHLRTELLALEGQDLDGELLVSRTGEAQQQPDLRGGRPVVRRGPTSTHARSQSVPVVQEGTEQSKPTGTKYGTWGTKMVSEDWEGDFEFGSRNDDQEGKSSRELFSVPESIQASQPRIKAHSVKIRELSLLVEDLKRLCQHGRESDLLNNERGPIWKEAEGIIALATIDYKNDVDDDDKSGTSIYLDAREAASSTADEERGELALRGLEAIAERNDRAVSRTAVIRERQSPRRRSVFSPEDDIFGVNRSSIEESTPKSSRPSRPRTPERASDQGLDNVVEAWSVKDILQLSTAAATPIIVDAHTEISRRCYNNRVPFDSNNLMDLVKRASELRDILSDIICRADRSTQSPVDTPRRERRLDSSPAFTRVFDDPGSSPPRRSALSRTDSVEEPSSLNSCMSANTIQDE
ncbi:hypothetical protein AAL_06665 [Moelleriella libera RCEF 2490]|uniref:Uncharacterized protein n=1 Tax=Moelleriella libera RCEF 2490 TaxID=1081109 RepID=A0A167YJI6_9HYPO|nr:hypothetical protein AAL_06665 [Moelleriella libera RCEF 2490]